MRQYDQLVGHAQHRGQPARGLAQVEHSRGLGAEAGDRVQPEQDVLDVLAGLEAGQGRARLQLDRAAVDGEAGQLAAPAQDRHRAVHQRAEQLRLEAAEHGAQQAGHLARALEHLGRGHPAVSDGAQPVGQQRVADAGTQVVQHQLRDVEPARRLQRRQAGRAHRLGDDAAGHELDVGRIEHAVVVGEPDAGDRDRGVLQDQLDHLVGGLDVGQGRHHRRAAVEFAGALDPAEGHEWRLLEAALREQAVLGAIARGCRRRAM